VFIFNNNKIKNDVVYNKYIEITAIYLILLNKVKDFFGELSNIKPNIVKEQKK
jgi:hypothetical protein